jgi:hypothetical protein
MNHRIWIAALWGVLIGGFTLAAGQILALSDHVLIAVIQTALMYIMLPGLVVGNAVGSLGPAAAINLVINFGICFLGLRLLWPSRTKAP